MTDIEKILVYGTMIDKMNRTMGYHDSVIPWGKVGICIGLDILNAGIRSAKYKPNYSHRNHKCKRF